MQVNKQALIDLGLVNDNQAMIDKTTEPNEQLAALIAKAIKESGKTKKVVAIECGKKPQAATGWTSTGRISKETLRKLALVVGKPLSYFMPGLGEVELGPDIVGSVRSLPVVGRCQAGPDGLLVVDDYPAGHNEGTVDYWAKCDSAYALRIRGESMSPRYLPGEFVAVDPCSDVLPSQEVIVLLKDGRRLIKRLLWISAEQACFESINKDFQNITLERDEIAGLHRVMGNVPKEAFRPNF